MKRMVCLVLTLTLLVLTLTACGLSGNKKSAATPGTTETASVDKMEGKVVHGVINRIDNYLVLLTDDGEYQVMDYGEGVTVDDFSEGDSVNVTYTGELGVEGSNPVIVSIEKAQ